MKTFAAGLTASLLVLAVLQAPHAAHAAQLVRNDAAGQNPVVQVVGLIKALKASVEQDGRMEQQSYDKYACWCEDTLARKAKDISTAKQQISDLQALIVKLKAEIQSHGAEIADAKKGIAANIESRREATEVRDKENAGYADERSESEQCTGALEAAIKVLTGAGQKKGFLETMQVAKLLSVVAGVREVLAVPKTSKAVSSSDLDVVQRFVEKPEDFVRGGSSGGVSAAQVGNNPFGDYAPQSTQIQGILKGMYDTFVGDMEKSNADEADAQKAFEALMATKLKEEETLQATLQQHELDSAEKTKKLAESGEILDDTKAQLAADEEFFATTKSGCQTKASEWSERVRLRTEELQGITKCIEILTSPESAATFENATTTFVQLSSKVAPSPRGQKERSAAFSALRGVASRFKNTRLAQIALQLKSGGHFDKVMASIDAMIELLRKEEQDDIQHRDRCQNAENKNSNDMEDLNHDIEKAGTEIGRLGAESDRLAGEISALEGDINATETNRAERLNMRNEEVAEFRQILKDDSDAVALLERAIVAMTEFYRRNKLPLALVRSKADPEYTVDQDKAPETSWSGSDYGGRKSESEGLVAILEMVKEDLQKEMETARADDAKAQALYEKEDGAMKETLDKQVALKVAKEKELSDVKGQKLDTEEHKAAKEDDHSAEVELQGAIGSDCSWVETHFETRREKRKAELDGLQEAKSFLAGAESGDGI